MGQEDNYSFPMPSIYMGQKKCKNDINIAI